MIGYYVHHHGSGHATRAAGIAAALDEPVVALGSSPAAGPFAQWVNLPRDDQDAGADEHGAGGALHWAPLCSPGYRSRMAAVAAWIASARPAAMVVDVSVEVTVLCRTLGVPVVVVAGAGERPDAAHELGYRLASRIVAPWPRDVYDPVHLRPYAGKTVFVGAFSRFDGRACAERPGDGRVVVLFGTGGSGVRERDLAAARAATPGRVWQAVGLDRQSWSGDVWAEMAGADVVVTHAGQNALAEVAAARRPAVVIPQERPFGEQVATAAALRAGGLAVVRPSWPRDWAGTLAEADELGADGWSRWNDGGGAARAARAIEQVSAGA